MCASGVVWLRGENAEGGKDIFLGVNISGELEAYSMSPEHPLRRCRVVIVYANRRTPAPRQQFTRTAAVIRGWSAGGEIHTRCVPHLPGGAF